MVPVPFFLYSSLTHKTLISSPFQYPSPANIPPISIPFFVFTTNSNGSQIFEITGTILQLNSFIPLTIFFTLSFSQISRVNSVAIPFHFFTELTYKSSKLFSLCNRLFSTKRKYEIKW